MSLSMILSDLEGRDAKGSFFSGGSPHVFLYRLKYIDEIRHINHVSRARFPSPGSGTQVLPFWDPNNIRQHHMAYSNQILYKKLCEG